MDNVYDLVEDFYGHDPGWNFLLRREYADGFLRTEAWQGKSPEELYDIWDQLTMLCLYLGNTELLLGDMSADDFVDCVARNLKLIMNIQNIFWKPAAGCTPICKRKR